jgi:DNA-binding NarL/FixJ family response regulator
MRSSSCAPWPPISASVAAIGRDRFEAEIAAGRGLSRGEALRLALGQSSASGVGRSQASEVLGHREEEVARLVADGLTNKEIGHRLFISPSTVATHVRSILNKLGFNSRAQIAGWIGSSNR